MNNIFCFHGVVLRQILLVWSSIDLFSVCGAWSGPQGPLLSFTLAGRWNFETTREQDSERREWLIMKRPSPHFLAVLLWVPSFLVTNMWDNIYLYNVTYNTYSLKAMSSIGFTFWGTRHVFILPKKGFSSEYKNSYLC